MKSTADKQPEQDADLINGLRLNLNALLHAGARPDRAGKLIRVISNIDSYPSVYSRVRLCSSR